MNNISFVLKASQEILDSFKGPVMKRESQRERRGENKAETAFSKFLEKISY